MCSHLEGNVSITAVSRMNRLPADVLVCIYTFQKGFVDDALRSILDNNTRVTS